MATMVSAEAEAVQRYNRLRSYLQDGWAIDPPIFVRPVWHTMRQTEDAYHFVLRRADSLHLLVVPASPEVERFVEEQCLPMNRL